MLRLLVLQRGVGGLHPACLLLRGNFTSSLWWYRLYERTLTHFPCSCNKQPWCCRHYPQRYDTHTHTHSHTHTHYLLYHIIYLYHVKWQITFCGAVLCAPPHLPALWHGLPICLKHQEDELNITGGLDHITPRCWRSCNRTQHHLYCQKSGRYTGSCWSFLYTAETACSYVVDC
jgi:hypothetical protein